MSSLITFNGSSYIIPATGEVGWGSNVSNYLIAIAAGCLQKTGGSFTLSAETDFGATYGLKSAYYKSRGTNVAATGAVRLANAETGVVWRTFLNDGDLALTVNASNQLTFNGTAIGGSGIFTASRAIVSNGSGNLAVATTTSTEIGYVNGVTSAIQTQLDAKQTATLTAAHILVGNVSNIAASVAMSGNIGIDATGATTIQNNVITNAMVNSSAAIAYSKLTLTGSIVNADVNASAAIAYSKLNLSASIVNADINASAAIAYSKLNLTGSIVNADVNASAAIAYSKLALTGSIVNADISSSAAIAITKIAIGTANQIIGTNAGATANEFKTLTATANQVSVTHGVGTVTFATPQDIGTSSAVRFGSLTLGGALDASSILSLTSTTKGFLPPSMTTTQKNAISSPTDGLIVYDSSLAQLFLRAASAWTPLSVGGGSGTVGSGTQYQLGYYAAGGTTISGLTLITGSRALASDANGLPVAATTTATELGYVNGVTSAIQTQLGTKAPTAGPVFTGQAQFAAGSAGTPSVSFSTAATTGLYQPGTNKLGFSAAGTGWWVLNVDGNFEAQTTTAKITNRDGSAAAPSYAFADGATGMYRTGSSNLRFASGGVNIFSAAGGNLEVDSGNITFVNTATQGIVGTTTNDTAAAGNVGETVLGNQTTYTNFPTSTQWGDLTSISLTAGDWLVWGTYQLLGNGGTTTEFSIAVTTTTGNSTTGFTNGLNNFSYRAASLTGTNEGQLSVPAVRFSLSGTTIIYLKYEATWSTTAPQAAGNIRALRIR